MHRGHGRMYRHSGLPPWVEQGRHGPRHREGCCHHGATHCEKGYEPVWAATAEDEREFLEDLAGALRRHLGRVERRISELEPSEA